MNSKHLLCYLLLIIGMTGPTAFGRHQSASGIDEKYFLHPMICMDSKGVDCSKLKLGDSYLSTSSPARGKLYSCNPKTPLRQVVVLNASPGLISSTTNGTSLKNFGCRRVTFEPPKELTPKRPLRVDGKLKLTTFPKTARLETGR